MIRLSSHLLLISLFFSLLLYEGIESKRGGSSGRSSSSRGSSSSRSSSRGSSSSSSGSKSSWFGGSGSKSSSSSSSSRSWGGGSSHGSSGYGSSYGNSYVNFPRSHAKPSYGSSGRSWSNRWNGNTFVVMRSHTYYGGGGYGRVYTSQSGSSAPTAIEQTVSEQPTITTEKIRDALFPGNPRMPVKEIFDFDEESMSLRTKSNTDLLRFAIEGAQVGMRQESKADDRQLEFLKGMKKVLSGEGSNVVLIKDETQPVIISSIPYFWGDSNLPQGDNETDCVDFSTANVASNFTVCNVTSLIRCNKSLSEVVFIGNKEKSLFDSSYNLHYGSDNLVDVKMSIRNAEGKIVDAFAWFCPPSDKCCEWECCSTVEKEHTEYDPPDAEFQNSVVGLALLGIFFVGVIIAVCCYYVKHTKKNEEMERRKQIERREAAAKRERQLQMRERRQDEAERQPLTAGYPQQPAVNPTYGWSQTPSAPPDAPPSYQEVMHAP